MRVLQVATSPPRHALRTRTLAPIPACKRTKLCSRGRVVVRAGEQDASTSAMTLQEAQKLLGVKETDSFDSILAQKSKQASKAGEDQQKVYQVR